jgi:hypothetical protein
LIAADKAWTTAEIAAFVGNGKALCINEHEAFCMEPPRDGRKLRVTVPLDVARQFLEEYSTVICRADREDLPREEDRGFSVIDGVKIQHGYKAGWESSGLPGDTHDVYRFIQ